VRSDNLDIRVMEAMEGEHSVDARRTNVLVGIIWPIILAPIHMQIE